MRSPPPPLFGFRAVLRPCPVRCGYWVISRDAVWLGELPQDQTLPAHGERVLAPPYPPMRCSLRAPPPLGTPMGSAAPRHFSPSALRSDLIRTGSLQGEFLSHKGASHAPHKHRITSREQQGSLFGTDSATHRLRRRVPSRPPRPAACGITATPRWPALAPRAPRRHSARAGFLFGRLLRSAPVHRRHRSLLAPPRTGASPYGIISHGHRRPSPRHSAAGLPSVGAHPNRGTLLVEGHFSGDL